MKLEKGVVLHVNHSIPLKHGYTISKKLEENILLFYLGKDTDISEELYFQWKCYYVFQGKVEIIGNILTEGDMIFVEPETLCGIKSFENSVVMEITVEEGENMNLEKGKVFQLKDEVEYMDGAITNFDVVNTKGMKFMLMAFDEGEGLPEHAAPGNALVMALEGKAILSMDGKESEIEGGSQFVFEKGLTHSVKAITPFKMALLLVKEEK
ncbi:MAG: cupin domain-containing protein [Tissierellia bacterium]|nr:cupin domain-containing protein [Tissierellia bacterium]